MRAHIGGIVRVDKEYLLDDETVAAVREALEHRGVLVFPRLNLTGAQQIAFTDKLGKRVNYTRRAPGNDAADEEDVYAITLDKEVNNQPEYVLGTFFWHIDGVTIDQSVPKATLLSARKLSPTGGQTEFASTSLIVTRGRKVTSLCGTTAAACTALSPMMSLRAAGCIALRSWARSGSPDR